MEIKKETEQLRAQDQLQSQGEMHERIQIMTHRVITMLTREEIEFLDKLGKDSLFSTGHKLCYGEILRWLVAFAMEVGLSGEKIDSVMKFKEKMLGKVKEYLFSNKL